MTAELDDYLDRVPSQNAQQQKFLAVLAATLQPFVDARNVIDSMAGKFDLDLASGEQLDRVGQWVGLSRQLTVPIADVYFSFNTDGLGFNEGVWFNSSDPAEGVISMDDTTYRLMLYAKIAANVWDGSLGDANALLAEALVGFNVWVKDNMDMTMSLILNGSPPTVLFQKLIEQGYIQMRPAGVEVV